MPCPSCTNSTIITTNCGCAQPTCQPVDCGCKVYISSDCVTPVKSEFSCLPIETGLDLTQTLEAIDQGICDKFEEFDSHFDLVNIGTGSEVYKGVNLLGQKEIRKINAVGDLATVTQNTNDISVSIDEEVLTDFIQDNQNTYTSDSLGDGADIYKDNTVVGDNTQFNFRSLKHESQGDGESTIRDVQINTNDLTIRSKTLKSNTISITSTDTEISFELPSTSSIPSLYVNNLYEPTYDDWVSAGGDLIGNPTFDYKGEGTLAKPFTDTVRYTSTVAKTTTANTSIQNALDAYVGSGTRLAPELIGQKIIIQNNNSTYTFAGDFSYESLDIEINASVLSTTTGRIVDMDNATYFDATNGKCNIQVNLGFALEISGDGFWNGGNSVATTTYATQKVLYLKGMGLIISKVNNINKYIINADPLSTLNGTTGLNNDGHIAIEISCILFSNYGGITKIGGLSRVRAQNAQLASSSLDLAVNSGLEAFYQTGGELRIENTTVSVSGFSVAPRNNAFIFEPDNGFEPTILVRNSTFVGQADTWFNKINNDVTNLNIAGCSTLFFAGTELFGSTNLWEVSFRNNTFEAVNVDFTKVDFTQTNTVSSVNTIGNNVIESLVKYGTRTLAEAVLPIGSKFINTNSANVDPDTWFIDITMQ